MPMAVAAAPIGGELCCCCCCCSKGDGVVTLRLPIGPVTEADDTEVEETVDDADEDDAMFGCC